MKQQKNLLHDVLILICAFAFLFIPVYFIEHSVLHATKGIFMYPLDDTFIHMDVAKNIVQSGTWGITKDVFASASSSVLYTMILALCFKLFSVNYLIPFIINCITAIVLILVVQQWLKKQAVSTFAQIIILFSLCFFTPLPTLVISGMEHTLQCLFVFLFIFSFADFFEKLKLQDQKIKLPFPIYFYGFFSTAIRYEGIFLVAIICLILLLNKKIIASFALGFISVLPVILFGIYSISKGSFFLPNSVLLKSQTQNVSIITFISNILIDKLTTATTGITALASQRLLIILPLVYLFFRQNISLKISYKIILTILISASVLHLAFAATGWFYRYEAYLVFCSVIIIGVVLFKYSDDFITSIKTAKLAWLLIFFFLAFPFLLRSVAAFTKAKQACINIYEQQYQMGNFVNKFYSGNTVAANDIGAVSFLSMSNVLDLWGLGNIDVAKSKKNNYWTPSFLDSLANKQQTKVAIVYDKWFDKNLLSKWKKIATWKIQNNVICGDDNVSFYAVNVTDAASIKNNLQSFQSSLPADVHVIYFK